MLLSFEEKFKLMLEMFAEAYIYKPKYLLIECRKLSWNHDKRQLYPHLTFSLKELAMKKKW